MSSILREIGFWAKAIVLAPVYLVRLAVAWFDRGIWEEAMLEEYGEDWEGFKRG